MDMDEIIWNLIGVNKGIICMYSGSYREGLRLKFLDQDIMFCYKRFNIICDVLNFVDFYLCIMFMEYFVIYLGFVKLKFLILVICLIIKCFVVMYMNNYYILSIKFRNIMYYILINFGVFIEKL